MKRLPGSERYLKTPGLLWPQRPIGEYHLDLGDVEIIIKLKDTGYQGRHREDDRARRLTYEMPCGEVADG